MNGSLQSQHITVGMDKKELRKMLRQSELRGSAAEAFDLQRRLHGVAQLQRARVIMVYCALPDEVSMEALVDRWVAEGKTIVLPRVVSNTEMEVRKYGGRHDLAVGAFGILEPTGQTFTPLDDIDAVVVPGMAFDREGHRLGRGKGYYDRFLARVPHTYKIGVCFRHRLLDTVPCDEHDIRMDLVVG